MTRNGQTEAHQYLVGVERVLLDDVIMTDYGQFELNWDRDVMFEGDFERVFAGQVNGLVGAARPGLVYVSLARQGGESPMDY